MHYDIRHETTLQYEQSVSISQHVLHLEPRDGLRQAKRAFELLVDPPPEQQTTRTDFLGNHVHHLTIQAPHDALVVEARSSVEIVARDPGLDLPGSAAWDQVRAPLAAMSAQALECSSFAYPSPYVAWNTAVRKYAMPSFSP